MSWVGLVAWVPHRVSFTYRPSNVIYSYSLHSYGIYVKLRAEFKHCFLRSCMLWPAQEKRLAVSVVVTSAKALTLSISPQRFTMCLDPLTLRLFHKLRPQLSCTQEFIMAMADISTREKVMDRCREVSCGAGGPLSEQTLSMLPYIALYCSLCCPALCAAMRCIVLH